MQAEPNLEGAVAVDHRGQRFALGRTSDAYAVWPLSGGAPLRTFPLEDRYWGEAWQAFQEMEAGPQAGPPQAEAVREPPAAMPTPAPAGPPTVAAGPEGVVVMDFQGSRFGVGRTRDAYAIWDLSRGGPPVESHPLTEDGWQAAWQRYQQHEGGAAAAAPPAALSEPPAAEPDTETLPAPAAGPDLRGATALDYRGSAYALGRTAEGYAIWDVTTGGAPILTFPATPEAWNQAWGAYQRLEGPGGG